MQEPLVLPGPTGSQQLAPVAFNYLEVKGFLLPLAHRHQQERLLSVRSTAKSKELTKPGLNS